MESAARQGYAPPSVTVIGSLEELTQGVGIALSDTLEGQVSNGA